MVTLLTAARAAGSAAVLGALAVPLALVAGAAVAGRFPWGDVARSPSVLLWLALLGASLIARGAAALAERRHVAGLAALACALVVAQGWALAALTLDVLVEAGEGEEAPPVVSGFEGRGARSPELLALVLPREVGAPALLRVRGRGVSAPVGREVAVGGGWKVRVQDVFAAPVFVVRRVDGRDEPAVQVKLRPGKRDYFEVGTLPHRFYVTLPAAAGGSPASVPAKIALRIQRGKLAILDGELAQAEPAVFETLQLRYGEGSRWAPIQVRYAPRPWLAGLALVLAAAALALALRRRRRA